MDNVQNQERQIVYALSNITVSKKILDLPDIKALKEELEDAQTNENRLDRLRQEKKEGNFLSNWLNDRDEKIEEAQLDLSRSVSRLTQKSSQLLIFNTAISKVLAEQQGFLEAQQGMLMAQAERIEDQNARIFEQQELLSKQQTEINEANRGLMEAKGITQEQAQKLVGCVNRVTESEDKIAAANRALREEIEQRLVVGVEDCVTHLNKSLDAYGQQLSTFKQVMSENLVTQSVKLTAELNEVRKNLAENFDHFQTESRDAISLGHRDIQAVLDKRLELLSEMREEFTRLRISQKKQLVWGSLAIGLVASLASIAFAWPWIKAIL